MAFGGGGSAGMTNHVHNNVPLQGGPLDFANDTIASLNVGSTTFSDGAALQELVIGNPADTLVVNGAGTAPEWGAAGGGIWTADGTDSSTTGASALTVSGMTGRDITQILFQVATNTATNAFPYLQINGITTGTYNTRVQSNTDPVTNYFSDTGFTVQNQFDNGARNIIWQGEILLYKGISSPSVLTGVTGTSVTGSISMAAPFGGYYISMGTHDQPSTAAITQIDLFLSSGNIYGKMQVNSMDYQ